MLHGYYGINNQKFRTKTKTKFILRKYHSVLMSTWVVFLSLWCQYRDIQQTDTNNHFQEFISNQYRYLVFESNQTNTNYCFNFNCFRYVALFYFKVVFHLQEYWCHLSFKWDLGLLPFEKLTLSFIWKKCRWSFMFLLLGLQLWCILLQISFLGCLECNHMVEVCCGVSFTDNNTTPTNVVKNCFG